MNRILATLLVGALASAVAMPAASAAGKRTSAAVAVNIRVLPTAIIEFPQGFGFFLTVRDHHNHGRGHDHGDDDGHGHGGKGGHNDRKKDKSGKYKPGKNDHDHGREATVDPVLIPFKIRGNAVASVSVRPEEFMRVYGGPYLGAATGPFGPPYGHAWGHSYSFSSWPTHGGGNPPSGGGNKKLGYNVALKFPIPAWTTLPLLGWLGFGPGPGPGFALLPGTNGAGTPPLSADLRTRRLGAFGMIFILSKPNWTVDGRVADEGRYGGRVQVTVTASN
jgi:hypothetical protein